MSHATDDEPVVVPADLARRIRLALDHVPENRAAEARGETTSYGDLATELVRCAGYPLHREPWEGDPVAEGRA